MTFEKIVAREEIAHNEQFILLPQSFQFYPNIQLLYSDIFLQIIKKSTAADLLYVGKV